MLIWSARLIASLQYTDFPQQASQVDVLCPGRHCDYNLDTAVSLGTAITHWPFLDVARHASIRWRILLFLLLVGIVGYEGSLIGKVRVIRWDAR